MFSAYPEGAIIPEKRSGGNYQGTGNRGQKFEKTEDR
jgi:hypothetical protein